MFVFDLIFSFLCRTFLIFCLLGLLLGFVLLMESFSGEKEFFRGNVIVFSQCKSGKHDRCRSR